MLTNQASAVKRKPEMARADSHSCQSRQAKICRLLLLGLSAGVGARGIFKPFIIHDFYFWILVEQFHFYISFLVLNKRNMVKG